jgi:hypothetical protein
MNDSGASHITKAIVSITVEETRLQKNKVLRMMKPPRRGGRSPGVTVEETRLQKNKVLRMMLSKKRGPELCFKHSSEGKCLCHDALLKEGAGAPVVTAGWDG